MVGQIIVIGTEMVADFGVGIMAGTLARACTPENASTAVKVCTTVGGMALGGAASAVVNDYIEDYAETIKEIVEKTKEKRAERKERKQKEKPIEVKEKDIEVIENEEEKTEPKKK